MLIVALKELFFAVIIAPYVVNSIVSYRQAIDSWYVAIFSRDTFALEDGRTSDNTLFGTSSTCVHLTLKSEFPAFSLNHNLMRKGCMPAGSMGD